MKAFKVEFTPFFHDIRPLHCQCPSSSFVNYTTLQLCLYPLRLFAPLLCHNKQRILSVPFLQAPQNGYFARTNKDNSQWEREIERERRKAGSGRLKVEGINRHCRTNLRMTTTTTQNSPGRCGNALNHLPSTPKGLAGGPEVGPFVLVQCLLFSA